MKFADGKTSSANVPHLNVWDFDISAAEFPQQKKRALILPNVMLTYFDGCHHGTVMSTRFLIKQLHMTVILFRRCIFHLVQYLHSL